MAQEGDCARKQEDEKKGDVSMKSVESFCKRAMEMGIEDAKITWARSHAPSLVIPIEKDLDFKAKDGFPEIIKLRPPGFPIW